MAASYLHGVESIEVERGQRPVRTVKSAVIGLIGTAPIGPVNTPTLVLSEKDKAQFGHNLPGFTIPNALDVIFRYGAGAILVINVLDPHIHKKSVSAEALIVDAKTNIAKTAHAGLLRATVKSADGVTLYTVDKDYVIDLISGTLTCLNDGTIPVGTNRLQIDYDYADPQAVTAADIIGKINAQGVRTGLSAFKDTYNSFGLFAKILISPVFCTQESVVGELITMAEWLEAITYIDAPIGATCEEVLKARGPEGRIKFNTASDRVRLCYPHVNVYDAASNSVVLEPLSVHAAGLRAKVDLHKGFWWSSSNQELAGVIGIERPLSAMIDDPYSDVNRLNENGITSVFSSYGSGFRLWGNRTAAWPTVSHVRNFENVRRTGDIINESISYFSQSIIDTPLNQATIDALVESVNSYGRKLIGDGALLGFKAWFDPGRNPHTELANGHLLVSYKYTVPPPLELLTFETEITSEYLLILKKSKGV